MQTFHIMLIIVAVIALGLIALLEINRRKTQKEERSWMDIKHDIENDPLDVEDQVGEDIDTKIEFQIDSDEPGYISEDEIQFHTEDETQLHHTKHAEVLEQTTDNQDDESTTEYLIPEDADEIEVKPDIIETEYLEGQAEFNFSKAQGVETELADEPELQIEYEYEDESETIFSEPNMQIETEPETFHSEHEEMFALSIMAQDDDFFEGADLIREFTAQNLQFGDMGFYHRAMPGMKNINLFSVTNIMQPGKFDPKTILDLKTKGLLLFMHLPGKLEPTQAFDQFYDAADALAITLGGKVCDEHRNILSRHRLGQIRDKIRHLELKLELERKKANKNS